MRKETYSYNAVRVIVFHLPMLDKDKTTILYIDLEKKEAEVKVHTDLTDWLGGLGVAVKLYSLFPGESPVVFTNGPFTLTFPFAPFTCTIFRSPGTGKIVDAYGGGSFAAMLGLAGYDGLVIRNKARRPMYLAIENEKVTFRTLREGEQAWQKEGLAGMRSVLESGAGGVTDGYFHFGTDELGGVLRAKNLLAVVVSGSHGYPLSDLAAYSSAYEETLAQSERLPVKSSNFPSCFGCPLGCQHSGKGLRESESDLAPFLVSCPFIGGFYKEVPLVFSLLSVLGLSLPHEQLEALPLRVAELRRTLM
ncbi:MAG: aldehyde ferredoxin oxidoreductase N-terminal domain-containing protein [Patescibacteria group bacterium]